MDKHIVMVAVSGDCAGNKITVSFDQANRILEFQALSDILTFTLKENENGYPPDVRAFLYDRMIAIQDTLRDDPFTNKYQFRSNWAFC